MTHIYNWLQYSKKQSDYNTRIEHIEHDIATMDEKIHELACDVANFMDIYQVNIGIIRNRVGTKYQATWIFSDIRKSYKSNTEYALKVNDFARLTDEDKKSVSRLLYQKDEVFRKEILRFEKRRQAINQTLRILRTTIGFLQKVQHYSIEEQLC